MPWSVPTQNSEIKIHLNTLYNSLDQGRAACHKASTYIGQHNIEKCRHVSMSRVGFEHTIPVFELS
jgi:hypothetical protein